MEEWKSIVGYEGFYEVSNTGIVRSVERDVIYKDGRIRRVKSRVMSQSLNSDGYMTVHLSRDGNSKRHPVHKLVAIAFVDGYVKGLEVDHIDADRTNNISSNLQWVTHEENIRRTIMRGSHICTKDISGSNNPNYGNHILKDRYANDKELSKRKQSRPGVQNGRATKIVMICPDGTELDFLMIKSCSEYLRENQYTKCNNINDISSNISSALKNKNRYLGFFYRYT